MNNTHLLIVVILLLVANLGLLVAWMRRRATVDPASLQPVAESLFSELRRVETALRDELTRQRAELRQENQSQREEVSARLSTGLKGLLDCHAQSQRGVEDKLEGFRAMLDTRLRDLAESSDQRAVRLRQELNDGALQSRNELRQAFSDFKSAVQSSLGESAQAQAAHFNNFAARLEKLTESLMQQFDHIRQAVEAKLGELQSRNEQKLEEMRKTVDEKLEGTLERRLGESFKLVSERLEQVHKGLGEMQVMASSVGDLKRVLTNVKTRGTWGEIQLGALLEQILTAEQYAANVAPQPSSSDRVEYAIRLPGRNNGVDQVWLPIDAKFPHEDYQRVLQAAEEGDKEAVEAAARALENRIREQAREIRQKYIAPPHTTDFAILFLPSEGLYAEVLRRPGLSERLQTESRVVIAGPTTLAAVLNSLQMGFKTLAIQERSSEVWRLLAAVKGEFGKFGEVLGKVKKKLEEASNQIEQTEVRTRVINRKLREVEALPSDQSAQLLPPAEALVDELPEEPEPGGLLSATRRMDK